MKTRFRSFLFLGSLLAGAACVSPSDDPTHAPLDVPSGAPAPGNPEPVSTVKQAIDPGSGVTVAKGVIGAVQGLYSVLSWLDCNEGNICPETSAQQTAALIIQPIETFIATIYQGTLVSTLNSVLSASVTDFNDVADLGSVEETNLFDTTRDNFFAFSEAIMLTDKTSQAGVDLAYALAPAFNINAALLDNLARIELVRHQIPMDWPTIQSFRATTLATNEALVGSQNLWFQCSSSDAPTMVDTVANSDGTFPSKILWKEFADYQFAYNGFSNNCDLFRLISAPGTNICSHDCNCDYSLPLIGCLGYPACAAGALAPNGDVYRFEISKILAAMNHDPVVQAIRASTAKIVSLPQENGAGVLWRQSSGELDLWNVWSATSYEPAELGVADLGWQPIGTGDFNGDGTGDVLWQNGNALSLWLVSGNGFTQMTTPTTGPATNKVYTGDLDGDGVSDLVWSLAPTQEGYSSLTWIMNSGSTTPRSTSTFVSPTDMVQGLANFDADASNLADILYRSQTDGTVRIAFNGGAETPIGDASLDWQIEGVGDFNGDGFSDILWYNVNSGSVALWAMGPGNSIIANVTVGNPVLGSTIEGVGDFDHDGSADILWRENATGYVSWWMMNASPIGSVREMTDPVFEDPSSTFAGVLTRGPANTLAVPANPPAAAIDESPVGYCTGAGGTPSGTLRNPGFADYEQWWGGTFDGGEGTLLGDVDGDGKADLVGLGNGYVGLLPSTGTGFGDYQTAWPGSFFGSHGTFLADVNGDSKADLVGVGDGYVGVLLSTGQIPSPFTSTGTTYYTFGSYQTWFTGNFWGNQGTFLADVNGDGKADLVAVNGTFVGVLLSTGSGFGPYQQWYAGSIGGAQGTLVGDIDGDGMSDIVLLDTNQISVMRSNGAGFYPPSVVQNQSFWGDQTTLLADVDGNGSADLIAIDDASVRVMRSFNNSDGSQYLGNADGVAPYTETWWGRPWTGTHGIFVGDIDGNSRADLVAAGDGYIGAIRSQ